MDGCSSSINANGESQQLKSLTAVTSAEIEDEVRLEEELRVKKMLAGPLTSSLMCAAAEGVDKLESSPRKGLSFLEYSAKRVTYCGIPSCGVKTDRLKFAKANALLYYGFQNRMVVVKICSKCADKADEFEKKSIEAIRNGESVFKVKREPQGLVPEMVNLDDDENAGTSASASAPQACSEMVEVDFERGEVEGIVKNILRKFNIKGQVESSTKQLAEETCKVDKGYKELEQMMNSLDDELYSTCKKYNSIFDRKSKSIVTQEVEINANGTVRRRHMISDDVVFVNRESLKNLAEKINKPPPEPRQPALSSEDQNQGGGEDALNQSIVSIPDASNRKPGPASKTGYYEALDAQRSGPFDRKLERPPELRKKRELLPTPPVIPRQRPKVGDIVYAMNKSLLNYWLMAEVMEAVYNDVTNQNEFIVHFEPIRNGKPTGGEDGEGTIRLIRQLCLKQMAYNIPCPFVLPVGSRVIAKFKAEQANLDGHGQYYAGIIAEPPKATSKQRYLIFFDDGYAQYVYPDDVLLVCESSKLVWNDIYPDSYDFVKEYVTRWPNWPLVKLYVGSMVSTEWNGTWSTSRVIEVDNCLALVRFENDQRMEWIYRGSTRFRPVYKIFAREGETKRQQETSKENRIPRHDPEEYKNRNLPSIEYKGSDISSMEVVQAKGARKSTGRFQYYEELQMFTNLGGLPSNFINMLDPDLCIEFQGTLSKLKIPADVPQSRAFVEHTCGPSCVVEYVPSKELKRISPLAIPFHFGWAREVTRGPRHSIFYRAPCGVRLRDADELAKYLDMTDSNLSMDHFCFEYAVDCLSEFVPARALRNIKDISYGKEGAPVQCINSVDYEDLPYMEYTPNRILGRNVELNTDKNFLVCCDCTDNCQDKSKCACWKLTHEGIAFTRLNNEENPTIGYEHRRLKDHVVSGIFECNSSCSCKKTCSNRVVQHGVQWPLQIFKTTKKGWGIRALFDMPYGTFICIYAGQILNDQTANEDGMEFGDEYLAELDYIECNEAVKDDYESDVTDIEAEEEENENDSDSGQESSFEQRKLKKKKRRDNLFENDEQEDHGEEADEEDSELEKDCHADDADFVSRAAVETGQKRKFATRRTNGQKKKFDFENIVNDDDDMITARTTHFSPRITPSKSRKRKRMKTRDLFGENEQCYIMDAKSKGNIGRYLNHSCCPNVIVQNVFVDTHDIRFPMVAFFTNSHVRAGTELTWDYHYQIGSVPEKELYCFCMTPYCRGRLL